MKELVRQEAIEMVRIRLVTRGMDPLMVDEVGAFVVLDELLGLLPHAVVSQWFAQADDFELRRFCMEWREWRKRAAVQRGSVFCQSGIGLGALVPRIYRWSFVSGF